MERNESGRRSFLKRTAATATGFVAVGSTAVPTAAASETYLDVQAHSGELDYYFSVTGSIESRSYPGTESEDYIGDGYAYGTVTNDEDDEDGYVITGDVTYVRLDGAGELYCYYGLDGTSRDTMEATTRSGYSADYTLDADDSGFTKTSDCESNDSGGNLADGTVSDGGSDTWKKSGNLTLVQTSNTSDYLQVYHE
jgi:hypothetical protein